MAVWHGASDSAPQGTCMPYAVWTFTLKFTLTRYRSPLRRSARKMISACVGAWSVALP